MALVDYSLTTVSRLKDYLGISSLTATEETVMENVINMVTNYVESYCGRRFKKTEYSNELYDGPEDERIILDNFPVISSETFTLQRRTSGSNESSWDTINSTNYFVKYDEGIINNTGRSKFIRATYRYRVSYTAGFDFDNSSDFLADTEAGDLEMACWMLCSSLWFKRKGSPDVKSEKLGDYSVTYGASVDTFFKDGSGADVSMVQATLDKYRRLEPSGVLTPANVSVGSNINEEWEAIL